MSIEVSSNAHQLPTYKVCITNYTTLKIVDNK